MSKQLTKMDIHQIKEMKDAGMSQKDIAYVMEVSDRTIRRVLNGEHTQQDRIADRAEHFFPNQSTGNYENGEEIVEFTDPTFETVAFEEEMEVFLEELEKNS